MHVNGISLVKLLSVQHSLILEWGLLVESRKFRLIAHLWVVVYTLRVWGHVRLRRLWEERHSWVLDQTHGILCSVSYTRIFQLEAHLSFYCHMLDLVLICLSNDELLIPAVLPLLRAASRIFFNLPQLLLRLIIQTIIIFLCDDLLWGRSNVCVNAMMSVRELYKWESCLRRLHVLRIYQALWVVVRIRSFWLWIVLKGVAVATIP